MTWQIVGAFALFLLGLGMIIKGGSLFVDAASWIAEASGIPKFIVGATVVSIATTLPELFASSFAAAAGSTEIAVGNAVGSTVANLGLILAVSISCAPLALRRKDFAAKGLLMIASLLVLLLVCRDGALSLSESALLMVILGLFIFENVRAASGQRESSSQRPRLERRAVLSAGVKFVLGAGLLAFGSHLLVEKGQFLAAWMGVPERIIAITFIAVGTSLPELVTAITALVKKQGSMSVGNILGANIIDLTLILPVSALLSGGSLTVPAASLRLDLPMSLLLSLTAVLPALFMKKFTRAQGIVMLCSYGAYLLYSVLL